MSCLASSVERFGERYDEIMLQPWMLRFYGGSGYYNTGYALDADTPQTVACAALVERLTAPLSFGPSTILDAGCGLGAVTRDLTERFPAARIIGINVSREQLARCRGAAPGAAFTEMDATLLRFGDGAFDAVVSVEAAFHFDTRAAFFAEALRVLRPGGTIVLSDILFADPSAIGEWMVPPANRITTLVEYRSALAAAGFTGICIEDATSPCWRAFVARLRTWIGGEHAARAISDAEHAMHASVLQRLDDCVAHYVLACAHRRADA